MIYNAINPQLLLIVLMIMIINSGSGQESAELKLYAELGIEDLFWQTPIKSICKTLPGHVRDKIQSLKTDVCIIGYTTMNCQNRENGKIRLAAGEYPDINEMLPPPPGGLPFKQRFESYHACERARGRTAMKAMKIELGDSFDEKDNRALVSFRDVEECTNMPEFTFGELNSINTYGSCVDLYTELDCVGNTRQIAESSSDKWVDLHPMNFTGETKSIMPCPETNPASKLGGMIQKISVSPVHKGPVPIHMEVTSNQFINRGDIGITQTFICSKSISQGVEIKGVRGLSKLGKISSGKNLLLQTDNDNLVSRQDVDDVVNDVSGIVGQILHRNLYKIFKNITQGQQVYHEETKVFTSNNPLDLKPCTSQTIDSFVEVQKGYEFNWIIELFVTSLDGLVPASDIVKILEGLGFDVKIPKVDDNTVMAALEGTGIADIPLGSVVNTMTTNLARCDGLIGSVMNQTMGVTIAPEAMEITPAPSAMAMNENDKQNEIESPMQPNCPPENMAMRNEVGPIHDKTSKCGGELNAPTGEIYFKVDPLLNSKRCVWVIRPNASEKFTSFKVDIGKGFVPIKGRREIILSGHSRLQDAFDVIPTGSGTYKVQGNILIIMFYTELPKSKEVKPVAGEKPNEGGIIRLRYKTGHDYQIYAISKDSKDYRINLGGTQLFTYPMEMLPPVDYPNSDLSTFVMIPPNFEDIRSPYIVNVDGFVQDDCCDYLMIYQFENGRWKKQTSSKEKERFAKGLKQFESKDVMLGVFHSDVIVPAGGFSMRFSLKKANYKLALNLTSNEVESSETGEYLL